jgi:hypothetical protein
MPLLQVPGDLVTDPLLHLDLGERLLRPSQDDLEPRLHIEGLEHADLLLEGEVGRVARHVGELTGIRDAPEDVGDGRDAARLGDRLDRGAVLARERRGALGLAGVLGGPHLDPGSLAGPRHAEPDRGPPDAADHDRLHAVAEPPDVLDRGDDADPRVAPLDPGNREQPPVVALRGGLDRRPGLVRLHREGDDHAGEHDAGREREEGQCLDVEFVHVRCPFHARRNGTPTDDIPGS